VAKLDRILETALYAVDLDRARSFYEDVLQLKAMFVEDRLCAFDVAGVSVLLLFLRGATLDGATVPGGFIPPHDGQGPLHMAFAISTSELEVWEQRLGEKGVTIESRVTGARGGQSIYFRDPDGNLLELATPGLWPTY
jgi:catechol 2,3-dioxygenase-like lactoylglutathione lyase family enzyme